MFSRIAVLLALAALLPQCKKTQGAHTVGLALDVGGRGDQSFNDGALRGLEQMAAGLQYTAHGYEKLAEAQGALPIPPPIVLAGKAQEDYEPNLALLVDQGAELVIAVGFMMEPAVRAVSARSPGAKFLLLDSPVLDASGKPTVAPNVRAVVFKEHEGSFLAGALAAQLTRTGKIGFVGGMQLPLIRKFEAGYRAGVRQIDPKLEVLVAYTGTFDDEKKGVEVGQDLYARGCDIVFHAAGLDGLGVIKAAQEAGKLVIGVDSDQSHVAPKNVLTSMVKRVDLAVYGAVKDVLEGKFSGGDTVLGLRENGVGLSPIGAQVPLDEAKKAAALAGVEKLRAQIVAGQLAVPATLDELSPVFAVTEAALELRAIVKRFGGAVAVDSVSLQVAPGTVLALVGENGAGKSTLISVACGLYRPDSGEVRANGKSLPPGDARAAIDAGLGVVYQHFMLVGPLTVWENVVLGREPRRLGLIDRERARREVREAAQRFGLLVDVDARVESLSVAAQQRVEIVKQLWRGARVLILDEPTAVLAPIEADELLRALRSLAAEGRAIVFISHKLREVLAVADRIAVLRRGKLVLETSRADATVEALAAAVTGSAAGAAEIAGGAAGESATALDESLPRPTRGRGPGSGGGERRRRGNQEELATTGSPRPLPTAIVSRGSDRLTLTDIRCNILKSHEKLRGLSLRVGPGEVLGVAGVDGNGQQELAEILAGLRPFRGEALLDGAPLPRTPAAAHAAGIVHLPEDRHRRALCLSLNVEENVALGRQRERPFASGARIDRPGRSARARELIAAFDVRPPEPLARAGDLSGGNQQKLVVARELLQGQPRLVIAVQPTRGLDFTASARVREALREAARNGAAVLLVSLDLDELRALSDRIAVLYDGRVAGLVAPDAPDAELGRLMLGQELSVA